MSPALKLAVSDMQNKSAEIETYRARLRGCLQALTEIGGFPGTVAALQSEMQSLAAREVAAGRPLGDGWIS